MDGVSGVVRTSEVNVHTEEECSLNFPRDIRAQGGHDVSSGGSVYCRPQRYCDLLKGVFSRRGQLCLPER